MTKIANIMIVSLWWLICCIPVITIIPACTALYDTMVTVINANGDKVTGHFFRSFRDNFKAGWVLSVICVVFGLILYTAVDFGAQLWTKNLFFTAYLAIGLVIVILVAPVLIFLPPVIAHFSGKIRVLIRLAVYFSWKKPLRTLFDLILLAFVVFAILYYPLLALLLPGLYADVMSGGTEKTINAYLDATAPEENAEEEAEELAAEEPEPESSLGFDEKFKE